MRTLQPDMDIYVGTPAPNSIKFSTLILNKRDPVLKEYCTATAKSLVVDIIACSLPPAVIHHAQKIESVENITHSEC